MRFFRCVLALVVSLVALTGCAAHQCDRDAIYQVSTLHALMEGVYDGETTVGELTRRGDLGIGTFNALDGEMMCVDGKVYQVAADGKATAVEGDRRTPFACMTFFDAEESLALPEGMDFAQFCEHVDRHLATVNLPYALRIEGTFSYVKTRSVPAQTKPYPKLVEVTKNQPTFEFRDVSGVMVGFRLPQYMNGINVPGYHIHFLVDGCDGGGHLLEFKVKEAAVALDATPRLTLVLPEGGGFASADLSSSKDKDVEAVEK